MFRPVQLSASIPGSLLLHSMPGRFETWAAFEAEARTQRLDAIACLTSEKEIREKSPAYAAAIASGDLPFQIERLPIPDFSVPTENQDTAFRKFIAGLANRLQGGETVLLHCGAGIGRTGIVASCILIELGIPPERAIELVGQAGSNPERAVQERFVRQFAEGSLASGQSE